MAMEGDAAKDMKAHVKSYARFTFMMKWGSILAVIIGFVVILIIAK